MAEIVIKSTEIYWRYRLSVELINFEICPKVMEALSPHKAANHMKYES